MMNHLRWNPYQLDYTYPDDFPDDRNWQGVVEYGRYFRLIMDFQNATLTEIPNDKF